MEREKLEKEIKGQGDFQEKHNEDLSFMNIQINDEPAKNV